MTDRVLIIDFGSQVTQLIARRVREGGVYCEIIPYNKVDAILDAFAPKAIILSGFAEFQRVREAQALGAGAYLRKPVTLDRLAKAVREELDRE